MTRKELLQRLIKQAELEQDIATKDEHNANVSDYADKFMRNLIENTKIEGLDD